MTSKWLRSPKEFWDSTKSILLAVFVALVFRYSVAAPYKIPSGSMIPTLKIGDFIFVSKLSYGVKLPFTNYNMVTYGKPKRGDIIVFKYPENPDLDFIKRVVGVEGDVIEIKEDILYVNNVEMKRNSESDKSILDDLTPVSLREAARLYSEDLSGVKHYVMELSMSAENFGPVTVPKNQIMVMGDNRDNSRDSRVWGFLPLENVRGRALFTWLSWDMEHWRVRWERFGRNIR